MVAASAIVETMSLKAKIEAVLYAAEEPVTLAQLAGIFGRELPVAEVGQDEEPGALSLVDEAPAVGVVEGIVQSENLPGAYSGQEQPSQDLSEPTVDSAAAEADAKRLARQRERQIREGIKAVVDALIEEYAGGDRGMEIREVAGGYRIATKPEYHDAVRAFVKSLKPPMKLSLQALETLAVIAYKQPVTAPEVAEIRGVDSSGVLGSLVSRKLITTAGRKQVIGRPILYKTTREFLLRFGLKDLGELPSMEEFEKLAGDIEIGEEEAQENAAEAASPALDASLFAEPSAGISVPPTLADGSGVFEDGARASVGDSARGEVSELVEEQHG